MIKAVLKDWKGEQILQDLETKVAQGLQAASVPIWRIAQEGCPYETGLLRSTGEVTLTSKKLLSFTYNTKYAVRLHEHPEFTFSNGKRGKWLTLALYEGQEIAFRTLTETMKF